MTEMRAKGRAKRRIAIILTLIMALQSVFAASAFAGTEGDVLNVHITNAYWTVKASENGQAVPFETGFTMTKGQGKGMTAAGSLNFVGGKNNKASGYGVSYTFLNSYVLNEGGPVYTESVANSEAISKINYKGNGEVLVTFADKSTTTLNTTDLYISPAYKVNASWRLAYSYIDNVSTGSGSWYNTTGSTSSFSHTFKDPSKATPVAHYRFVNWTNFETGETYGEGIYDARTLGTPKMLILGFEVPTLQKYVEIFDSGDQNISIDNLLHSLGSNYWKFCFVDIYRCIERLFVLAWVHNYKTTMQSSLTPNQIHDALKNRFRIEKHEKENIEYLFTLLDPATRALLTPASGGMNPDNYIYELRNKIVHYQKTETEIDGIDAGKWNVIVRFLLASILELYPQFSGYITDLPND